VILGLTILVIARRRSRRSNPALAVTLDCFARNDEPDSIQIITLVLKNIPAEVAVLGEIADVFVDVSRVDADGFAMTVRRDE